jgi:hypothetical protein
MSKYQGLPEKNLPRINTDTHGLQNQNKKKPMTNNLGKGTASAVPLEPKNSRALAPEVCC